MNKIYCSNCGELISTGSKFCSFCGAPQHGRDAANYQIQAETVHHGAAGFLLNHADKPEPPKIQKPEIDVIKKRGLARAAQLAFFFTYLGRTVPLLLLLVVGIFFDPVIFGIVFLCYLVVLVIIAAAVHDSFKFSIDDDGFQKEYGIINHVQVSIPYHKIENVNITRSFSDLLLGLARINIETAGNADERTRSIIGGSISTAEGHLPGVTLKDAKHIHDLLIHRINNRSGRSD